MLEGTEDGAPKQVLVLQALEVRPSHLDDAALAPVLEASRALTFARAGHCELAREAASRAEVEGSLPLARAARWMAAGARACCAIRGSGDGEAAAIVEAALPDAEALEAPQARLDLLRAWVALARGDEARGRALFRSAADEASADEREDPLLDALRSAAEDGSAAHRLVDRRWMSAVVHETSLGLPRAEHALADRMPHPALEVARVVVSSEREALAAARARYPFFDQGGEGPR